MSATEGQKARYRLKSDGTEHVIDDHGRTCSDGDTCGGIYKTWSEFRKLKGSRTGYTSRCVECVNAKAAVRREEKRKEVKCSVITSPINIFLMSKWNKTPSFCA